MSIKDLNSTRKFILFFGFITIVTILGFAVIVSNLFVMKSNLDSIYNVRMISLTHLVESDRDAYQSSIYISQALNLSVTKSMSPEEFKEYRKKIRVNLKQMITGFNKFRELYLTTIKKGETESDIQNFDDDYKKLSDLTAQIIAKLEAGDNKGVNDMYLGEYNSVFASMRTSMSSLTQKSVAAAESAYKESVRKFRQAIIGSAVAIAIIVLVLVFTGFILGNAVRKPVKLGLEFARIMSEGDMTYEIKLNQKDEFGKLTDALNNFRIRLCSIVKNIQDISQDVATAAQEMSATSVSFAEGAQSSAATVEQLTSSIEEVSTGMENVSSNAQGQSAMMEDLIANMNKLSDVVKATGEKINTAFSMGEAIVGNAKNGAAVLNDMNRSMSTITDSSRDMIGIVKIINDISDQINLLSLNAAIEAARAGDAGRGFAVVADEISKLAEQTAQSLKDIDRLIRQNGEEIEKGKRTIESTTSMIQGVTEGVTSMADRIREISLSMDMQLQIYNGVHEQASDVRRRTEEITLSMDEQKSAVKEISNSVENINNIVSSNASGAEELASSTENVSAMTERLYTELEYFKIK